MKKHLGKILVFLLGVVGVVVMFLRGLFDTKSAKHEAAKLDVAEKAAVVEEKKADVKVAEEAAAKTHESVDNRLAELEAKARVDAARDTIDVANDIIKGA
jgi:hypothetical protein